MEILGRAATDLATAVQAGELRAVDVVRAHLDRIERLDPLYGAFVSVRRSEAIAEAEALGTDRDLSDLPLAGVPVAVKDNVDVAGEATCHGLRVETSRPVPADAPAVAGLRAAGAVVVGKTTLPEMALWPFTDGPGWTTRNAWDTTRVAGGSSGGSGVAVAAGMVPLALGNDGLGSIRIPAAVNGLFGIKPGSGLVPVEGLDGSNRAWFGMAQNGPIATTVADAALMLDVMAGTDRYRRVPDEGEPLRVAVSVATPTPAVRLHRDHVEAVIEAGRLLRHAGHHVVRADPPYRIGDTLPLIARWTQGVAEDLGHLGASLDMVQPRTRRHAGLGALLGRNRPVDPVDADRVRARMDGFFDDHDVLLSPVVAGPPPEAIAWHAASWRRNVKTSIAWAAFPGIWNLADLPAGSVPLSRSGGRPVGVQVVGARRREDLVLRVGRTIESLVPWDRTAPVG